MKNRTKLKELKRLSRHKRIRKQIAGTQERPRLCVHRSLKNLQAQLIDDSTGNVLFGISTLNKNVQSKLKNAGNIKGASLLGEVLASEAKSKGITEVCFDRGGYCYHGRIKAFADAVRKNGLEF